MNLFDKLVAIALKNQPNLSTLKVVVEKELLHHDILRTLSHHNLLENLTFIGGTCLRCCYGSVRLSEDLDFTGGNHFTRDILSSMSKVLTNSLYDKYGLRVEVSEPIKDKKNVSTWKVIVQTRPEHKHLPAQRINIDICAVPSYEKTPMLLLNPYGVDMGTSGLIIQAQSKEEIYTDKLITFALRPNRIKYRDLWDIIWLHQQNLQPRFELIPKKLNDRNLNQEHFFNLFDSRKKLLTDNQSQKEFMLEMNRFLPKEQVSQTLWDHNFWSFLVYLMNDFEKKMKKISFLTE